MAKIVPTAANPPNSRRTSVALGRRKAAVSATCHYVAGMNRWKHVLKTIVVSREGTLSVADHLTEMRAWLAEHGIEPCELVMLHVLNFRIVFRATFDTAAEADQFVARFG